MFSLKKLVVLTTGLALIVAGSTFASPYLVANPPDPVLQVQGYNVYIAGEATPIIQTAGVNLTSSGSVIIFDIAEQSSVLPLGASYNLEVTAWNAAGESPRTAPFSLTLPQSAPASPSTMRLEQ